MLATEKQSGGTATRRVGHRGAVHVDLTGAANAFRYRAPRLEASGLASILTCELVVAGRSVGPFPVLDVSPSGLGVGLTEAMVLPPGTAIDEIQLIQRGTIVARQRAVVVNLIKGTPMRLGLRIIGGMFDVDALQLRDTASLDSLLADLDEQRIERELLPVAWRAAVADVAQLLERTRDFFDGLDERLGGRQPDAHEQALFTELFETWGPQYHGMLRDLHEQTAGMSDEARRRGLDYAGHLLLPLVHAGPIHRRAYDKPQGYAGDYELMRLFFAPQLEGDTLYARFLHYVGQRYPMSRTVVAREKTMREAVRARLGSGRRTRVLSLACGPALELQNLLRELPGVEHPVQLYLLDQDEDALAHAHGALHRLLVERGSALSGVELSALHFSVMQLLCPRGEAEAAVAREMLGDMDLVYSAGLFDYLPRSVGKRLVQRLYGMLRPGGELFIGNLREDPASAWMMEHAVAWHLIYREPDQMLELAKGLPHVQDARVVLDETGRCMFLHVRKASHPAGIATS